MTAFELKQQIDQLRNTAIPVQCRDQMANAFPLSGVQTDLDNLDTELAFVLRIQTPQQSERYLKEDVLPLVRVLKRVRSWIKREPDSRYPEADVQMAIEHAQDLGLEDK